MVKRGGLRRKIPIEKIKKKTSRGPCCSKRYQGLFGKASQLCLLSGAQIAVLATPMSHNSHVSFYSFGHSSVDAVVSAFLSGKRPLFSPQNNKPMREDIGVCLTQKNLGLGFWWEEDEAFSKSQNPKELSDAVDSMRKLLKDAKQLRSVDHHQEPDQTLTTPAISDDFLQNTDTEIMSSSEDAVTNQLDLDDHAHQDVKNNHIKKSDHVLLGGNQEPDQTLNLQSTTCCIPDDCRNKTKDTEVVVLDDEDLPADNFEGLDNELDLDIDQLIDFDSTFLDDLLQNTDTEIMSYSQDFCIMDNNALPAENLEQTLTTPARCCISDDFLQNSTDTEIVANSQDFCIMDNNNNENALPAENLDDIDMDLDQLIDFETTSETLLSYGEVLKTSFESLISNGIFESTQELQEFADSLLTFSDSHDSMDPSLFSDSQPVKDGDLVLQNRGLNDDHLHFSEIFNELTTLVTL